jgi:hypothetical protein
MVEGEERVGERVIACCLSEVTVVPTSIHPSSVKMEDTTPTFNDLEELYPHPVGQ